MNNLIITFDLAPSEDHEHLSRAGSRHQSGSRRSDGRSEREGRSGQTKASSTSRGGVSHGTALSTTSPKEGQSVHETPRGSRVLASGSEGTAVRSVSIAVASGDQNRQHVARARDRESASTLSSGSSEYEDNPVDPPPVDPMSFHINLPFSARQNQATLTRDQKPPSKHKHTPKTSAMSTLSPQLTTEQERKITECLWVIEPILGIEFNIDAIVKQVVIVEGKAGVIEMCEKDQVRGICVVDEGEMEVMLDNGEVVVDELRPGDFCGELAALFRVPQNIKAKFQNGYVTLIIQAITIIYYNITGSRRRPSVCNITPWLTPHSN